MALFVRNSSGLAVTVPIITPKEAAVMPASTSLVLSRTTKLEVPLFVIYNDDPEEVGTSDPAPILSWLADGFHDSNVLEIFCDRLPVLVVTQVGYMTALVTTSSVMVVVVATVEMLA